MSIPERAKRSAAPSQHRVDGALDQRGGHLELVLRERRLHEAVLQLGLRAALLALLEIGPDAGAQGVERLHPLDPDSLREGVVERRHLPHLHRLEGHPHVGDLPAQLGVAVIAGERLVELDRLADPLPGERAEVPLRDRARRDAHRDALGARALERPPVDRTLVIDHRPVALLGVEAALGRDELGHRVLDLRELVRDHLVRHLGRPARDLEAAVVLRLDLGLHLDARGVAERAALGDALRDRDVRRRDDVDRLLTHGLGEGLLDDLLDHLALDLGAEVALEHLARRLAGTEAAELRAPPEPDVRALELLRDLVRIDLDADLPLDGGDALDLDLHCSSNPLVRGSGRGGTRTLTPRGAGS